MHYLEYMFGTSMRKARAEVVTVLLLNARQSTYAQMHEDFGLWKALMVVK